jgi:hypothetical protein
MGEYELTEMVIKFDERKRIAAETSQYEKESMNL